MNRTVLVHLMTSSRDRSEAIESMAELEDLARAAGARIARKVFQTRASPDPRTFIGGGKVEEIKGILRETGADLVLFDQDMKPSQQRSLEQALEARVIDRTQLILDIFARRARTTEGKLQVELAQLTYLLPRLTGKGKALSRLGGGIGTRGPGETKLETDRRRIEARIARIRREVRSVAGRRAGQRRSRKESLIRTAALVGYTSVGKTTLFNRLAGESAFTSPQLFATLDPLVRRTALPDGLPYFISDTVGFVKRLPPALLSSFKATLEEVLEAGLILHVIDLSAPNAEAQAASVEKTLAEIGARGIPTIRIYNKIDRLPDRRALLARNEIETESVYLSAVTGEGLPALKSRIRALLFEGLRVFYIRVPHDREDIWASLEKRSLILKRREGAGHLEARVMAEPSRLIDLAAYIVSGEPTW
ncbi:MAG TPA: GTPase HflX [Candidatus Aminicenantes bacterium]|nr:MAG: GTPase HflX [Candidatus Aminicenantes bacterium ADurb.Bin147]HNT32120.1 GTPase HflX [Candidatus Aminicenantes bacterium]HOF81972.1 GTPase HflX [Candidatus Aminicenantes bacterium]HOS10491.1 GTPase HflX [Candidatus Aminicenantes bacterium]HOY98022.1 GTPase HflX [Candidatus Aminicenantes bacterium]